MKVLSCQPRRDGKFMVRVDFTHTIKHYVLTTEKLAELKAKEQQQMNGQNPKLETAI